MKMTETVDGNLKVGAIGDDTQSGQQLRFIARGAAEFSHRVAKHKA